MLRRKQPCDGGSTALMTFGAHVCCIPAHRYVLDPVLDAEAKERTETIFRAEIANMQLHTSKVAMAHALCYSLHKVRG